MKLRIAIILFSMATTFCSAQNSSETNRKGFLFSFGGGVSAIRMNFPAKSENQMGVGLNWKIGYSINPRLAIALNGAINIYDYAGSGRPRKRDFGGLMPSLQYWVSEKIWLQGGIGIGTDAPVFYDIKTKNEEETKYYTGFGAVTAVGYEFYRAKKFVLDVQGRVNFSQVNLPIGKTNGQNFAVCLGINFY
jgi:Outer membrane protein beta-barrel domain